MENAPDTLARKNSLQDKWHTVVQATKDKALKGTDIAVLVQLIESSDKLTNRTFVGAESIAEQCHMTWRTVSASLSRLELNGYCAKTGETENRSYERLLLIQKCKKAGDKHPEFWAVYPKRQKVKMANEVLDRLQAYKPDEYRRAIEGAKLYALSVAGKESKYIKFAHNWLIEEKWLDDVSAPDPKQEPKQKKAKAGAKPKKTTTKKKTKGSKPVQAVKPAPVKKEPEPPKEVDLSKVKFPIGQRVCNPSFGEGVVLGYEYRGSLIAVNVHYDSGDDRWQYVQGSYLKACKPQIATEELNGKFRVAITHGYTRENNSFWVKGTVIDDEGDKIGTVKDIIVANAFFEDESFNEYPKKELVTISKALATVRKVYPQEIQGM